MMIWVDGFERPRGLQDEEIAVIHVEILPDPEEVVVEDMPSLHDFEKDEKHADDQYKDYVKLIGIPHFNTPAKCFFFTISLGHIVNWIYFGKCNANPNRWSYNQ